jgi:hypothetical protein
MFRPTKNRLAWTSAALVLALAAMACGGPPEEAGLRQFFRAAQLRDSQTLANFAAVNFDPQTDGIVQSFKITSVSEEQKTPLKLKELSKAFDEAKASDDEFSKQKRTYQDANLEAIDRVIKAERANAKLKGKDAEVQTAWTKWRDEAAQHSKTLSDARAALNDERPMAELSLDNPRAPVDATTVEGDMVSKVVTADAQVKMPDGQVVPKTLQITMQRVVGKVGDKDVTGKWIISSIKGAGGAAPTS